MTRIKKLSTMALVVVLALSALGCVSVSFSPQQPAGSKAVGALKNNSATTLSQGLYQGGFSIKANSATLTGGGIGLTLIEGDIRIDGNNCVLRNLSVRGNVYLNGNNADLTGARIEGRVFDGGRGNRW